jgi:hypothetical protein
MIRPLLIGLLIINVLVILLLLLVGCSCHTYNRTVLRGETYSINPPHAVLDTPEMAQLTAQNSSIASGTQPWCAPAPPTAPIPTLSSAPSTASAAPTAGSTTPTTAPATATNIARTAADFHHPTTCKHLIKPGLRTYPA